MSAPRSRLEAPKRVVEETRRLYANLLAKAPDERQLARPSFKLIQDVVKSLITETRMLRQEFNASDFEEANSGAKTVWDKGRRCNFVQRLIDLVANNKQPVVGCVATKLVAGLEPVKCNELLQALARIVAARRQESLKTRTFTKPEAELAARRAPESSLGGSSQATSRVSSRHSSATRRLSKDGASTEIRGEPRRTNNRLEASSSATRSSPSRRHSARAERPESRADAEIAVRGSEEKIVSGNKQESANESVGRETVQAGLLSDSDMSRNIQLLRSNLRAFQRVLSDVDHLDDRLRSRLHQGVAN